MVTEGRWWGKAHVLYMRAQGIDRTWIHQYASAARSTAEHVDGKATRAKVDELDAYLEQLENSIATYRNQWVAYQYEVEKLRRDLATYARTLDELPEVPDVPTATEQLIADIDRLVETMTAEAQAKRKR